MAAAVGDALLRDRLSDVPDSILVAILSFLPIDEAARSTALASRWRHLFPSTLFDFRAPNRNVVKVVDSILATHPTALVRSFRAGRLRFRADQGSAPLDGWLKDLANRGLEELVLQFEERREPIPESILACASLKHLRVISGAFPDVTEAAASSLARLTKIELSGVKISDESVESLLSQCTALEHLEMNGVSNCGCLRIRSRSLKVLNSHGNFDKLFIEDAPNLERVLGNFMHLRKVHIEIKHAPKLEFLGYLGMLHTIEIGGTKLLSIKEVESQYEETEVESEDEETEVESEDEEKEVESEDEEKEVESEDKEIGPSTKFTEERNHVKTMPSMKTLAVSVSYMTERYHTTKAFIGWFMELLKLFPCLETLYIKSESWSGVGEDEVPGSWDVLRSVPCINNHLGKVVLEVYRGHDWQMEMAKFFHGRSRFLKTMEFHCMDDTGRADYGKPPSEEWVRNQQELLCFDSRASRDARFLFFKHQLPCNHHYKCHDEDYKRDYYSNLYKV